MIRRVRIQGYKSLQDVEIHLRPLTVIFGPNAAGKSNLLDALALLSRMATRRTIKEAFEGHRGTSLEAFRYDSMGIKGLLSKERAQFMIEVDVELSAPIVEEVERRIHETAFREELARWRFCYFEPRVMRIPSPIKEAEYLGPFGEDLAAFYHTLRRKNERQFEVTCRALNSPIPAVERIDVQLTPDGFVELNVVENGIFYSARVISEGTLRVLGLLAVTNPLSPATLIGYEEPENGVHPRRLRLIAELLKETVNRDGVQIIVNTHSPLFPEYFEDEMLVVCRKGPEGTRFESFSSLGPLFRRQEIEAGLEETSPLWLQIVRGDWDG